MAIKPFCRIDIELLNDSSDTSSIELDGVPLCSCDTWEWEEPHGISIGRQERIHDTIKRVAQILKDHRDEKTKNNEEAR